MSAGVFYRVTAAPRPIHGDGASPPDSGWSRNRPSGPYLHAYATEMAWRNRRRSNGAQYLIAVNAALAQPVSRQWKGYWQRSLGR
jgi:hypothetical protein